MDEVIFGPYCVIASGKHGSEYGSFRHGQNLAQPISVGKGCWIAAHVVITAGSNIGENCLIAAGAVVTQDIPSGVIAGGIPAKKISDVEQSA